MTVHYDCEHWDYELGLCKLHTQWIAGEQPIVCSCDPQCSDYEKAKEHCRWCNNCKVDHHLNEENDFHAGTVGDTAPRYQIMIETGNRDSCRIEFNCWDDKTKMWHTVGRYYPKYCPECGRKIEEYK